MQKYFDLLKKLIRNRAVSSDVEAVNRSIDDMLEFFQNAGLHCTVETKDDRKILFVCSQPIKRPKLLLVNHLDVVPAADELYEPREENGWLIGRGARDCLGDAVCAAKVLCDARPEDSVGGIFSSDEEIGGWTAARMAELGYCATELICVMDTWNENNISVAEKGSLTMRVTAYGRSGHSSRPWEFDNPVDKLVDGYSRLKSVWVQPTDKDPWHDSLAATIMKAGAATNQVPDTAEMILNVRYTEKRTAEEIMEQIRSVTGLQVDYVKGCLPAFTDENAPVLEKLARSMERTFGFFPSHTRMNGATDARHFVNCGVPFAIIGVEGKGVHGPAERVRLDSIREYAEVLTDFLRSEN